MATQLYVSATAPSYTPSTKRGAWDDSASTVVGSLDTTKINGGAIASKGVAETNTSPTWDVLLARFVSGPLAAQTIAGTVDVILGVYESNAAADMSYHLHIYVTQGDSDTPRGTLLTDYVDPANEWGTSNLTAGKALQAAQSLSSLAVSKGDRLVVELGYIARNSVATSYTGTLYYGTLLSAFVADVAPDLAVGGSALTGAGFLTFSQDLTWSDVIEARAAEQSLEVVTLPSSPEARASEQWFEMARENVTIATVMEQFLEVASAYEGGVLFPLMLLDAYDRRNS